VSEGLLAAAESLVTGLRQTGAAPTALATLLAGVVAAQPGEPVAQVALAQCRWEAGDRPGAIAAWRAALALRPRDPVAAALLGIGVVRAEALSHGPGLAEGCALLEEVAARAPAILDARLWLGIGLVELRRTVAGLAALDGVLPLLPEDHRLHLSRGHALLTLGRLQEGWASHAWRWRQGRAIAVRAPADPLARPDPGAWAGRTVLLYAEQGHGDTLQCLRYVPMAVAAGALVVLEVQPALVRLARMMPGVAAVVAQGEVVPAHDLAVPMFHLPWAFGTELGSIPGAVPYLRADADEVARWRARVSGLAGMSVGLVWAGDPRPGQADAHAVDRRRSLTLGALGALAGIAGVSFVSLQKGAAGAERGPPGLVLHDWTDELQDFAATAALMEALDLVVSVDTAPAHLAGALGRPVWLLNRFDSCWRWLEGREDSPWYPTLTQFRQAAPGEWDGVVSRVAAALAARAR
jgi:hypothetical protein